jgi:hypothetical protein
MTATDIRLIKLAAHSLDLVANSAHKLKRSEIEADVLASLGILLSILNSETPSLKFEASEIASYMSSNMAGVEFNTFELTSGAR